jgi:hypothetical protein
VANVLIFVLAIIGGLGFVLFHNERRKQEHPPLPSVSQPKPTPEVDTAKPAKARACSFTSTDLDRVLGEARLAEIDKCKASGARMWLGIGGNNQVVSLETKLAPEAQACVATVLGLPSPSPAEPVMVCSYTVR